ncbi:alpha/beta-hydrolase [Cubamyces menziesii]|nr:alpha/beta-hydrolase [Cubamyces menziesii]
MGKVLNRQPFKSLYLVYVATSLVFVKLPIWTLYYLPRSTRPRRAWSLKRTLIVRTIQTLFATGRTVDMRGGAKPAVADKLDDADKVLRDANAKSAWIEPIPEELFCGELRRYAEITGVAPVRIPGYWMLKKGYEWTSHKAMPGEKTVLHFHGGAFTIGTARPTDVTANFPRGLLEHSKTILRTFAVDYRLAASAPRPQINAFPAALLDCLAGYYYLVQEAGFEPQNVIIAGDSAGANMALAIVRHLVENPHPSLPPPGRLVLVSACLDLMVSRCGPEASTTRNSPTDIFGAPPPGELFAKYSVVSYLGALPLEEADTSRYISPMSLHVKPGPEGLCKGFPESYIVAGGAERIMDDSVVLKERMDADGVKAVLDIPPDAVHDFVVFTWHEPERTETLQRISEWIDSM